MENSQIPADASKAVLGEGRVLAKGYCWVNNHGQDCLYESRRLGWEDDVPCVVEVTERPGGEILNPRLRTAPSALSGAPGCSP